MRRLVTISVIILTTVYIAYVSWLSAHHLLFYHRVVLKTPIALTQGFSVTNRFKVGPAAKCWVGVKYRKQFHVSPARPDPPDEFVAHFEILSQGKLVANGGTEGWPEWEHRWNITRDYVIRFLAPFDASAGQGYELSLQVASALPTVVSTHPELMVFVDPLFDQGYLTRRSFLIYAGAGIVAVDLLYAYSALCYWKRRRALKEE